VTIVQKARLLMRAARDPEEHCSGMDSIVKPLDRGEPLQYPKLIQVD
jgi:hypothetical protein